VRQTDRSRYSVCRCSLLLQTLECMLVMFNITSRLRQTDRSRYSVCSNRPHLCSTALRPNTTPHHNRFTALFPDHPGEPVTEENFCTLWCKGRVTEADTLTIQLGTTPPGLTSAHFHHPPIFLQTGCPSCRPTNSVKALKPTYSIPQIII